MLFAILVLGLIATVVYYERRSSKTALSIVGLTHTLNNLTRAEEAHAGQALIEMEKVCRPSYSQASGRSRLHHALDFPKMRYECTSVFDVLGYRSLYALFRSDGGEWRSKLLDVETLGEQYDEETGKLIHCCRFTPQAWADREYPIEEPCFDGEMDRTYRLQERAEVLEWNPLQEPLVAWAETTYQSYVAFFKEHKGWTPSTTQRELPTDSDEVWSPPPPRDEAEVQASFERSAQARRRTRELKKEQQRQAGKPT